MSFLWFFRLSDGLKICLACSVNVILGIQNISKQGAVSVGIFMRWVSVFMGSVSVLRFLAALHPTGLFRKNETSSKIHRHYLPWFTSIFLHIYRLLYLSLGWSYLLWWGCCAQIVPTGCAQTGTTLCYRSDFLLPLLHRLTSSANHVPYAFMWNGTEKHEMSKSAFHHVIHYARNNLYH